MTDKSNITERAYAELKSDLIACRLVPGRRITISQVQREKGFSQAAVREALSRLTAEGLVEMARNSGFKAAPISTTGFRELAEASMVVEIPCLRSAIANGDLEWEGQLIANFHVSKKLLPETREGDVDLDTYTANRAAFYETLLAPCSNRWLLLAWKQLYTQQMRYRHTFRKLAQYEAGLTEHYQKFIQAVCERNGDEAVRLCQEQYQRVIDFVEQVDSEKAITDL